MTRTLQEAEAEMMQWNAYAVNIDYHCPEQGGTFYGSANICPHCYASLSDLSHWKWYSPDEEHPREVVV